MSVREDVELLRHVPLFAQVDAALLQLLAFSAERLTVAEGEPVLTTGRSEDAGFLLLDGEAEAYAGSGEQSVARLERGAFLGELQMIAKLPASVSVRARSELRLMRIGQELFIRVCREFPDAGARMLQVLSRKLESSVKDFRGVQRHFEVKGTR